MGALPYPDLLYKEYDQSARAGLDPDALDEMAQYAPQLTSGRGGLGGRLAWPLVTVERNGAVSGFLMRRAPQQFVVQLHLLNGATQKLAEAQLLLNDEQYLAARGLPVHDRWRLQFLRDTADTLAKLHRRGIAVGDLSPKNLLASFSTRPCCFFLDCDSMRMVGRSALPQVETTGWESVPTDPAAALRGTGAAGDGRRFRGSERHCRDVGPATASARKGLVVNGVVFDYTDILKEHRALRQQYAQARLVWSGDWPVFKGRDFFVTVLVVPFGTAEGVNRWCDQQGIDRDHCFAKLLSQVRGPEGTTGHR